MSGDWQIGTWGGEAAPRQRLAELTREGYVRDALRIVGVIARLAPMPPYCALFPAPKARLAQLARK